MQPVPVREGLVVVPDGVTGASPLRCDRSLLDLAIREVRHPLKVALTPSPSCRLLLGEFAPQAVHPPTGRLGDHRRTGGEGTVID